MDRKNREKALCKGIHNIAQYYEEEMLGLMSSAQTIVKINDKTELGGQIRSKKGNLVENIAGKIVDLVIDDLDLQDRLSVAFGGSIPLGLRDFDRCMYPLEADLLISDTKNRPLISIECKSYTENAMMTRTIDQARMIKDEYHNMSFVLLQLENSLGGNGKNGFEGNDTTTYLYHMHPTVNLNVLTLLDGKRYSSKPIHKIEYYKSINIDKLWLAFYTIRSLVLEQVVPKIVNKSL
jgi:hypothetical protein